MFGRGTGRVVSDGEQVEGEKQVEGEEEGEGERKSVWVQGIGLGLGWSEGRG